MTSIGVAKKRLLANVGTNIFAMALNALIAIWLTRYLIRQLGLALYGLIPLSFAVVSYIGLLTFAISGTISRFVGIHLDRQENEKANVYFSTSFVALFVWCAVLLLPITGITLWLPNLFQIPTGYLSEGRWLFIFVMLFSLVTTLRSPFLVSTFVRHRFDLDNLVKIGSKSLQAGIIVFCFTYVAASVEYVGVAYLCAGVLALISSVLFTRRLTPELSVNRRAFRWSALLEMSKMGVWVTVNQVGAALYLSTDLLVINLLLGSKQVGLYGPFVQCVVLLDLISGAVARVFSPIAYDYIARNETHELVRQVRRSVRFTGLIVALPVGLLCGLSVPFLKWWLGASFATFSPLMWLLIMPRVVSLAIKPLFAVNQGLNRVKLPSIMTVVGGIINVVVSVTLVLCTDLGIYGVALATAICLTGKNLFFTPLYAAFILRCRKTMFFAEILLVALLSMVVAAAGWGMSRVCDLATITRLGSAGLSIGVIYFLVCYWVVMNKDDRSFVLSLIPRRKSPE
jgi:membrane protein EpsK